LIQPFVPGRAADPERKRVRLTREAAMKATKEARDFSILIADDDDQSRNALRDIVEPEGFETLLASSGEEAIDIVRGRTIHLVLLDMYMPTLTGLETLSFVRQINALLPAILVTADATESLVRKAIQAQVYSVIPKPVSKNVLLYTVLKALSRSYGKG
jgi:CheY-like chemotaxis protein